MIAPCMPTFPIGLHIMKPRYMEAAPIRRIARASLVLECHHVQFAPIIAAQRVRREFAGHAFIDGAQRLARQNRAMKRVVRFHSWLLSSCGLRGDGDLRFRQTRHPQHYHSNHTSARYNEPHKAQYVVRFASCRLGAM